MKEYGDKELDLKHSAIASNCITLLFQLMPFCYYFHATFFSFKHIAITFFVYIFFFRYVVFVCALCVSCAARYKCAARDISHEWPFSFAWLAARIDETKRWTIREIIVLTLWHWVRFLCNIVASSSPSRKPSGCIRFCSPYTIFVVIMKHFEFISSYVAVKRRDAQNEKPISLSFAKVMCGGCIVSLVHVANRCSSFARMSVDTFWAIFSLCDVQSKMKINTKQARENRY